MGGCYPDVGFWGKNGGESAQEGVEVCFTDRHFAWLLALPVVYYEVDQKMSNMTQTSEDMRM